MNFTTATHDIFGRVKTTQSLKLQHLCFCRCYFCYDASCSPGVSPRISFFWDCLCAFLWIYAARTHRSRFECGASLLGWCSRYTQQEAQNGSALQQLLVSNGNRCRRRRTRCLRQRQWRQQHPHVYRAHFAESWWVAKKGRCVGGSANHHHRRRHGIPSANGQEGRWYH
jgi:hypothetical protein